MMKKNLKKYSIPSSILWMEKLTNRAVTPRTIPIPITPGWDMVADLPVKKQLQRPMRRDIP